MSPISVEQARTHKPLRNSTTESLTIFGYGSEYLPVGGGILELHVKRVYQVMRGLLDLILHLLISSGHGRTWVWRWLNFEPL